MSDNAKTITFPNHQLHSSMGPGDPTPSRGFEDHVGQYPNQIETKRAGIGPRAFMAHGGPKADANIDRGPFSVRTKLTSKP
jgi:hypothetical protein